MAGKSKFNISSGYLTIINVTKGFIVLKEQSNGKPIIPLPFFSSRHWISALIMGWDKVLAQV
jgi:hypothetical protein